ncbi:MAG: hypothetical protein IJ509_02335 [Bacilli bacterium]|nr:hypothetical protein [Bacilli bacterium]
MKKDLPKMYQTRINKTVPSIQKVYSTLDTRTEPRESREERSTRTRYSSVSIERKIDDIFNSPDYVYKADVTIVTDT